MKVTEGETLSSGISGKENFRLGGVNGRQEAPLGMEKVKPWGVHPRGGWVPQGQSQLHPEKSGSLPGPGSLKKGDVINHQPRVLQDLSPLQLDNGVSGSAAAKKGNINHILQWTPSKGKRKEGEGGALATVRGKKTPNVRNGREEQGKVGIVPHSRDASDFISTAKKTPSSSMRPRLLGIGGGAMRVRGGGVSDTTTLFSLDSEDDTDKMRRAGMVSMKSIPEAECRGSSQPSPSDGRGLSRKLEPQLFVIKDASPPITAQAQQVQQGVDVGNDVPREEQEMKRGGGVPMVHDTELSSCKQSLSESEYGAAAYSLNHQSTGKKVEVNTCKQTPPESECNDAMYRLNQSSAGEKVDVRTSKKQSLPGFEGHGPGYRLSHSSAGTTPLSDAVSVLPDEFNGVFNASNVILVNGKPYIKMACIGRGGSSKVHRVLSPEGYTLALKRVEIEADDTSALFNYANEIDLLKRLRGNSSIISLLDSEVDRQAGVVHLLMELGEIDLNQLLQSYKSQEQNSTTRHPSRSTHTAAGLEVNFVRIVWQQMLEAVDAMHEQRVVHSDLKPANFVFCRGTLKLIDFGIAKIISNNTTNISRDSQVGTLNYMCPEAILDTGKGEINPKTGQRGALMKLGRASDLWSLGCILYQLFLGHTPFSHLRWVQKLQAIIDHKYQVSYEGICDPTATDVIKMCLQRNPVKRPMISGEGGLLSHTFLNPCSTSKSPAVPVSVVRRIAKESIAVVLQHSAEQAPDVDELVSTVIRRLSGK